MKSVVIFSGGMDSATLLWDQLTQGNDVHALTFNYGQRHSHEMVYANDLIYKAREKFRGRKIVHEIVDISSIKKFIAQGALTGDEKVPEGHYEAESMKSTVVPNRNMIMLSIAAGYAIKEKADRLLYGAHGGDHAIYYDCRKEFVNAIGNAILLADQQELILDAPFIQITKTDIVRLGKRIGVPYENTWSCYKGGVRPCLKCGTCTERTEAFIEANMVDPALTKEEWEKAKRIFQGGINGV